MTKRKSKGAYMISAVAEMYGIHPQTLRLYEREGLLKPSRTEGNTRLYTDEDLQRLEFILSLARDSGRKHQRDGDHPANARTHGRNAAPDPGVCAVHPGRSADPRPCRRRSGEGSDRAGAPVDGSSDASSRRRSASPEPCASLPLPAYYMKSLSAHPNRVLTDA